MLIHLSEVLTQEEKSKIYEVEISMDTIKSRLGEFRIVNKEPVKLVITHTGNQVIEIHGEGKLDVAIPCGRCLEDVVTAFPLEIERKLDMRQSEEERIKDLDESNYITGKDLDVDQLIYNEVLIHWPLKVLCHENCKGICSQCGTNLNHGSCDCDTTVLDPRMAAISDIFSKFKEV